MLFRIQVIQSDLMACAELPSWDKWLIETYGPLLRTAPEDGDDEGWVRSLLGPDLIRPLQLAPKILPALAYQYGSSDDRRMSYQSVRLSTYDIPQGGDAVFA